MDCYSGQDHIRFVMHLMRLDILCHFKEHVKYYES